MTTVTQGSTGTYTFSANEYVNLTLTTGNQAYIAVKTAAGLPEYGGTSYTSKSFGPFNAGDVLTLTALRGSVDYTISTYTPASGSGGAVASVAGKTGVVTLAEADLTDGATTLASLALKLPKAISFNAATGVATKADSTTFTPVSSTAPPAGSEVLICTTAGTLPTAVNGVTAMALNDGLEWVDVNSVWVWNKAVLATSDLSNSAAVPLLNSTQQTQVAASATVALLNSAKTALKDPAGVTDITLAPFTASQVTQLGASATVALLNSAKTALKDPAGGADIAFGGEQHISNYTASSTQTGVTTESAALMSLSLPILPAGSTLEIRGAITGNSDSGTTTIRLKFGTTTIATFLNGTGQTVNTFTASLDCVAAAQQWLTGEMRAGSTSPSVQSNNTTVDTSTAPTLNATLQNTTTTRTSQIAFISVRVKTA